MCFSNIEMNKLIDYPRRKFLEKIAVNRGSTVDVAVDRGFLHIVKRNRGTVVWNRVIKNSDCDRFPIPRCTQ